jgi:long-chain acyl-CoA synthetase
MEDLYSQKPWLKSYDKHVPPSLIYDNKTFAEKFAETAARYADKTALIYMGTRLSFREVDRMSNQVAHFLIQNGMQADDVIGLHLPNIPAHFISIIGVQKAGCVSTGLSPLLTPSEMAHQLSDSQAKMVFTVDLLFDKIHEVADTAMFTTVVVSEIADFMPGIKKVLGKLLKKIPTGEVKPMRGKTVKRFNEIMARMPTHPVAIPRTMDDTIFMMYTGGTTGPSKGAVLTHNSYMANCSQSWAWLDLAPEDIALSAFPLFHLAGLALGGFSILNGVTVICVPNPRDTRFLIKCIKNDAPTFVVNVPTIYFELMKMPEFKALDFNAIKWCLSGAAPFPPETMAELESVIGKSKFIELYGMTETSPVTCCNPRYGTKKAGSVGLPFPDTEFKLIDPETGQPARPGEPGEILVRGPQVMKGYFNKPEETANSLREGWMHTGDVARMDADGYFYLVDRLKDMVIVSGFKVFTRELDDVLVAHPDIESAASIGIPDPDRPGSERVACAVVLKRGVPPSDAAKQNIMSYLKEKVAPYKVPKVIRFMERLPTSGVGKVLKREIKKMMAAG